MQWNYGAIIQQEGGDFVVSVRDLPEVVTSGDTLAQAIELAEDAINVIVAGRIEDGLDLPLPSAIAEGEKSFPLDANLAAKASIYYLWRKASMSKSELGRRMKKMKMKFGVF